MHWATVTPYFAGPAALINEVVTKADFSLDDSVQSVGRMNTVGV